MPETQTFGVFVHYSGPQGGYVVRGIYDGWTPWPYRTSDAVRIYKRKHAAQAYADKLNAR